MILIAGPCVVESEELVFNCAEFLSSFPVSFFKASFDKANRTKWSSFRGIGYSEALNILNAVRNKYNFKITTDFHTEQQIDAFGDLVDCIQIPAFLSRQTDLLYHAARANKTINIKKMQIATAQDMFYAVEKIKKVNKTAEIFVTDRGSFFGYNDLVIDFRNIPLICEFATPIIDITHSKVKPFQKQIAKAAKSLGAGIFVEIHPSPEKALCDGHLAANFNEFEEIMSWL